MVTELLLRNSANPMAKILANTLIKVNKVGHKVQPKGSFRVKDLNLPESPTRAWRGQIPDKNDHHVCCASNPTDFMFAKITSSCHCQTESSW